MASSLAGNLRQQRANNERALGMGKQISVCYQDTMGIGRWLADVGRFLGGGSASVPVKLELDAWEEISLDSGEVAFRRGPGDRLIVFSFNKAPDIPVPLEQLDELRAYYRQQITEAGGAIVSLVTLEIDGVMAIEALFKLPQEPSGMTYLGSITLPFRKSSYVMRIQCSELGMTGMREAFVIATLDDIDFDDGLPNQWAQDPYNPDHLAPILRNKSEDIEWDANFPEHPLSRVRKYLKELRETTKVSDKLKSAAPFRG